MSDTSYLMGAILDPLVVEFMPPAYCEAMLEAKIRTDEIRNNCPPRAGYVCVLDPRVKGGRYYRKHVEGEGVKALPPSRIEKALAQQESRSQTQKGEGISFLGKAAIAGGLAIGGLAAIGAMANSGRSVEPVPDVPNAKVKPPDTSEKPKSSTYEEAKQQALLIGREKRVKPPSEVVENGVIVPKPPIERSPQEARRKRGSKNKQAEAIATKIEDLKEVIQAKEPVPLTKTTQTTPSPDATPEKNAAKKPKEKKSPVDITSMTAREASNAVIRDGYTNIPDKAGAQNIGYKSAFQLKNELTKQGVIRDGAANSRADFEALLDNNMLVEEGLLVQTKTGVGKYGKNNVDAIRVPAFMPVKDLSNAASNIYSEGKGGAGITDRVARAETLIAAITEKLDKAKDLTELERNQLISDRNRLTDKINVDNAKIKGSVIAEVNKPMGKPKANVKSQPAIAEQSVDEDQTTIPLGKPASAAPAPIRPEPVKPQAKRQRGLAWIDAKNDVQFYDKIDNLVETDERIAKFKDRANTEEKEAIAKRLKKMYDEINLSDPLNKGFAQDLNNAHYKIFGKNISKKKQINDAIATHETYYSAREQAKRDALRRFAA